MSGFLRRDVAKRDVQDAKVLHTWANGWKLTKSSEGRCYLSKPEAGSYEVTATEDLPPLEYDYHWVIRNKVTGDLMDPETMP